MKLLTMIILLLSINAYAQFKVEIVASDTSLSKGGFEKQDEAKAKKHLLKIIKKSQWMKGEWKLTPESDLVKVEEYTESVDTGETKTIQDMEGNDVEVPVYEYVDKTRNLYYHPSNFTYAITDITAEMANKKAKKEAKKARRKALKSKSLKKKSNETVGEWRDRISTALDEILTDLSE